MACVLIAFYSFSGNTKELARKIAEQTGGGLRELLPKKQYSFDYNTASKEVRSEVVRGDCPALRSGNEPITEYSIVFVGTPNWFKSPAPPVLSFLRGHDFSGKTVIPFCTHGGGGCGEIERIIAKECPGSVILPGFCATGEADAESIREWLGGLQL